MPVQTTVKNNIYYPDGAKVSIKASGDSVYTDLGVILSAVTSSLEWTENQVETSNAGKLDKQIQNMTISGAFTLGNLLPTGIEKLGGGVFTQVDTAASPIATIPNQDIAAGWADDIIYDLDMEVSSSDSTKVRTTAQPTITSVNLDPDGTPEVLVEDNDYVVFANPNSTSGWSISLISANILKASPTTYPIRIVYGSNTPVANTTLFAGTSTLTMTPYAMKITHTDSNSKVRELELFSVEGNSGGFQFNYKGAQEDGLEEMPLTYTAKLDTSLTDNRQLMSWKIEDGAA